MQPLRSRVVVAFASLPGEKIPPVEVGGEVRGPLAEELPRDGPRKAPRIAATAFVGVGTMLPPSGRRGPELAELVAEAVAEARAGRRPRW